jgi:ABC-2 type transport system ATP-binding protein
MNPIIEIDNFLYRYGNVTAVQNLSLQVPEGSVYAFLGTNGAGKTTTIKALLNLLGPIGGNLKVFGIPSSQLGPKELAQIGYVSESQKLPEELTVKELIDYSRAIYPTWDDDFCSRLLNTLSLPLDRKISQFSRGMKIKAAMLVSLAYRPRLLVLDEPFSGLDPLVRDELIQALIALFEHENWTMFISSHDIDDVERLADWVGIIDAGRLHISGSLDDLHARFKRIDITLPDGIADRSHLPADALQPEIMGGSARWIDPHFTSEADLQRRIAERFPQGTRVNASPLSLRDIFVVTTRALHQNNTSVL